MAQTMESPANPRMSRPDAIYLGFHCDPALARWRNGKLTPEHDKCAGWWPEVIMSDADTGFVCGCDCHHGDDALPT